MKKASKKVQAGHRRLVKRAALLKETLQAALKLRVGVVGQIRDELAATTASLLVLEQTYGGLTR